MVCSRTRSKSIPPQCSSSNLDASRVYLLPDFLLASYFASIVLCQLKAQMAHALSKVACLSPARMMASVHWRILIEERYLPTIPKWKALITDLRFWQRLVKKTLCRHARKVSSRWQYLTAKQSDRFFQRRLERDPANETAVAPAAPASSTLSRFVCFGQEVPVRIHCHFVWIGSTQVDIRFPQPNDEKNIHGTQPPVSQAPHLSFQPVFSQLR